MFQILVGLSLIAGLAWGWRIINDPAQFPIQSIKVQASYQHLDQKQLSEIIAPHVSRGMFHLNPNELKTSLQAMPWIDKVEIHRIWPDSLIIKIVEQQPVARWKDLDLINQRGQLFRPPKSSLPTNLPVFEGSEKQIPELWHNFQEMNAVLAKINLSIQSIQANARESFTLILSNGLKVFVGRNNSLLRLERFANVYAQIFQATDRPAESADLRYENGVSVKWQNIITKPPQQPTE